MTPPKSPANEPSIPEGCIAAIPRQSTESCELVIKALAAELTYVQSLLHSALKYHIYGDEADHPVLAHRAPAEARFENVYWQGWNDAEKLLGDLRRDWPHLDI